jgi:hypothetical protein
MGGVVSGYERDLYFEQDQESGRLSVTLNRDPGLTIEPIKEAFGYLDDTTNDAIRLKWLTIGGAVGLISAAAIGGLDRSLGKGGNLREILVDISNEGRGYFFALMLSTGISTSLLLAGGGLQGDVYGLMNFDLQKAGEIGDSLREDLETLNIQIKHGEGSTEVSFNPNAEILKSMEERSRELSAMMPGISDQDVALARIMLPLAGLALIGAAGSFISVASSVGGIKRGNLSAKQRAVAE